MFVEGSYNFNAHYAQFQGERPLVGGVYAHLPKFNPAVFVNGGYYVNYKGNAITIDSGWSEEWIMYNNIENIVNTGVSNGRFAEIWQTSSGPEDDSQETLLSSRSSSNPAQLALYAGLLSGELSRYAIRLFSISTFVIPFHRLHFVGWCACGTFDIFSTWDSFGCFGSFWQQGQITS
ncbi:MAG: hypothetical protein ACRECH_10895 [Nitrososphaerales archaeon]